MKIAWDETIRKMREMGYSEKEIEHIKEDPTDAIYRFIDQGREIILFFEHKGMFLQFLGIKKEGKVGFRPVTPKELKEGFFKDGWFKKK